MSPLSREATLAAADVYGDIFVGPYHHTHTVVVDVSTLDTEEVDANGYLKPGTPIQLVASGIVGAVQGALVTAADQRAGVVPEPIKVAADNVAGTLAAAADVPVAIAFNCAINRAMVEDHLGRAISANELAALRAAGVEVLD